MYEHYFLIKHTHMTAAFVSFALFFTRGLWMLRGSPLLTRGWVRVLPHVNDTLLLASAVLLTLILAQYPGTHGWLTAKLTALLVYIGVGMVALRHGRTLRVRFAAWLAALLVFLYIVSVALTRSAQPWVVW
jgi:uncharacterized membrane protein SirB2